MNQVKKTASDSESNHANDLKWCKALTGIVYILQVMALATAGITLVIAVGANMYKLQAVKNSWLESHFEWQLMTSLYALGVLFLALLTWRLGLGYFLLIGVSLWLIYRVVQGWVRYNSEKPMVKQDR